MNPDKKREFTPYAFGCVYFQSNRTAANLYTVEEIASTFYTPKSKPWGLFIEGFKKEQAL
jgi:hypothetical protein